MRGFPSHHKLSRKPNTPHRLKGPQGVTIIRDGPSPVWWDFGLLGPRWGQASRSSRYNNTLTVQHLLLIEVELLSIFNEALTSSSIFNAYLQTKSTLSIPSLTYSTHLESRWNQNRYQLLGDPIMIHIQKLNTRVLLDK